MARHAQSRDCGASERVLSGVERQSGEWLLGGVVRNRCWRAA